MTVVIVAMNLKSQFPGQQAWHGNVIELMNPGFYESQFPR